MAGYHTYGLGDIVEISHINSSDQSVVGTIGAITSMANYIGDYKYRVEGAPGCVFKATQLRLVKTHQSRIAERDRTYGTGTYQVALQQLVNINKGKESSMTKYKVGDLVKVVYDDNYGRTMAEQSCSPYVGKQGKILSINGWGNDAKTYPYVVEGLPTGLSEEEIKLISHKGEERMNILTFAKLSKEQRQLNKVGLLDDEGQLTDDGTELVLNILAQQPEIQKQLVELSKKYKDEECKK